jgi:glycerol kinase
MQYILALDQGTSSSRAIVFDQAGRVRAVAQHELTPIFPQPGWVEQDPNEIWSSQTAVVTEVLRTARLSGTDIAAIGISNQRETTVVWDRQTGQPIWNAIVWQDRRTAELCSRLHGDGKKELFRRKTGLVIDAYFSGTKLAWLLDQVPGARRQAEDGRLAFGTVDSWLVWQFTQGRAHLTDVTNASRTLLYNIHTGEWDAELLEILNIPPSLLPEVRPSSQVYAETQTEPWGAAIPIAGMAGDQQAALFGQCCSVPGMVKNTYGTGCFLLMQTGPQAVRSEHNLLTTPAWQLNGQTAYALEGSVFIGGAVVQWLRDGLGIIKSSAEVEPLAASVPDTAGVYLVPAFAGLGAPHWDPYARGTMVGLTQGTGAAHIARAALESIAYQSRDVVAAMEADARLNLTELRVDGGATANNLLMQFQADILGVPVVRPQVTETTALGAAYLAGLAVGYWKDQTQMAAQWQVERVFEPGMLADRRDALIADWQRAVERAKAWLEPRREGD